MENRIAVISIIITDNNIASEVNKILNVESKYIKARLGLPYKGQNIICIIIDANQNIINSLSGKLGKIDNVSVKANYIIKK